MKVKILYESGYREALFGIGLSYGLTSGMECVEFKRGSEVYQRLAGVAERLANKPGGGHNKFLEAINVCLDITAPRYWWSEFDTYRVGTTKQSESTMHTITKRHLTLDDFEKSFVLMQSDVDKLNNIIDSGDYRNVKMMLPESFLQRRVVVTNYKVLKNMYEQRKAHRLPEWHMFCSAVLAFLEHGEFIDKI